MYTAEQVKFLKENRHLSDAELSASFTEIFGVIVSKAAIRKKRQRMGLIKSAEQLRVDWATLIGLSPEEIQESLVSDPPVDIYEEQKQLSAAKRLAQ